jgi:hypothetical protein
LTWRGLGVIVAIAASVPLRASDGADGSAIAQRLPRVEYRGGAFVRHPRLVTITFAGDDPRLVSRLRQFGEVIAGSQWWHEVTDGYCASPGDCIGDGRPAQYVEAVARLPRKLRDADIADLLARDAKAGRFDPLDSDTLLLVYLPKGVELSDPFVTHYCRGGPRALHRALRLDAVTIPFAVVPRCGDEGELTAAASHELLEMATNPDPARRGFAFVQSSANLGFTAAGIEPVDPCGVVTMDRHRAVESGFVVQRAWSNRAAASGRDPCIPKAADSPFLALIPEVATVRLAQTGARATLVLHAAADRPAGSWNVAVLDVTGQQTRERYVDVSLDRSMVNAGDSVRLTIVVRKLNPRQLSIVGLVSTLDGRSFVWPVAVVMR